MEQRMKEAEANRRTVEYRIFYGDYKAFAGVQMPTRIQRMIDGQPVEELSLEKIKVNQKIDPKKIRSDQVTRRPRGGRFAGGFGPARTLFPVELACV